MSFEAIVTASVAYVAMTGELPSKPKQHASIAVPGVDYRVVNPAGWIERARPLLNAHWAELGIDFPLDPDKAAYQALHDAGVMFAVVALDGDELVGYCSVSVTRHPHNRGVFFAISDAFYVVPARRNSIVTARLMGAAEEEASRRGAERFMWACRVGTPLAAMLERHGYAPAEQFVMKEL